MPSTASPTKSISRGMIEFVKDRLYFAQLSTPPRNKQDSPYFFFTVDEELEYLSFYSDFGPLHIGHVYRFCIIMYQHLANKALQDKAIVLYCGNTPQKKANAALLISSYVMIINRMSPAEAFEPLAEQELLSFRDAGYGKADFQLSIFDCLYGLCKALKRGLLRLDEFNLDEYEYYEKVENGDFNFVSNHFIAFASPVDTSFLSGSSFPAGLSTSFKNVVDYFVANDVRLVVRLNKELYNRETFTREGIKHVDMFFEDGSCPDLGIVRRFIVLAEEIIRQGGKIAVHCKAGLGRTGTLIGAYLIYKYHFTAQEVIAFMRLMRPGMVVGPQAHYLYQHQMQFILWSSQTLEELDEEGLLQSMGRPITPPSDNDGDVVGAKTAINPALKTSAAKPRPQSMVLPITTPIPGQPRKTPQSVRASQILTNATAAAASGATLSRHSSTATTSASRAQRYPLRAAGHGHKRADSCQVGSIKTSYNGPPRLPRAPISRTSATASSVLGKREATELNDESSISSVPILEENVASPSALLNMRSPVSSLLGRVAESFKAKDDSRKKERRLSGGLNLGIRTGA